MTTYPRDLDRLLRTLAALPVVLDDLGPEDYALIESCCESARNEVRRMDQRAANKAAANKAAADAQRASERSRKGTLNVSKTPRRKPDPPELVRNRALAYERAQQVCEAGSPWCEGRPTQVHHIARRAGAGAHALDNLLAVCGMGNTSGCHGWIHQHPDEAKARGWLRSPGALPAVVDTKGNA